MFAKLAKLRQAYPQMADAIMNEGGFITDLQLTELVKASPKLLLLVRCGAGRFLVNADSVKHFCDIIGREGSDYVRDVSIPSGEWLPG